MVQKCIQNVQILHLLKGGMGKIQISMTLIYRIKSLIEPWQNM